MKILAWHEITKKYVYILSFNSITKADAMTGLLQSTSTELRAVYADRKGNIDECAVMHLKIKFKDKQKQAA